MFALDPACTCLLCTYLCIPSFLKSWFTRIACPFRRPHEVPCHVNLVADILLIWYGCSAGHVTAGGSICIEALTLSGTTGSWTSQYNVESILNIVILNMIGKAPPCCCNVAYSSVLLQPTICIPNLELLGGAELYLTLSSACRL